MLIRLRDRDTGAVAVETAFVLPILILLVFGIIEFGILFNRLQGVHSSARESARIASIVGVDLDAIQNRSEDSAPPFIDLSDLHMTVHRINIMGDGTDVTDATWTWDPATSTWSPAGSGGEFPCDATMEPNPSDPPAATEVVSTNVRVELKLLNPGDYGVTIPLFGSFAFEHPSTGEFRCEF